MLKMMMSILGGSKSLIAMKCEKCEEPKCFVEFIRGLWLCRDCKKPQSHWFNIRYVLCIVYIGLIGCVMPTSPSLDYDKAIYQTEWDIAVDTLAARGVPKASLSKLSWTLFTYRPYDEPVPCGEELARGCFSNGHISWWIKWPSVLRHEMSHGILAILGYDCWDEYEHAKESCLVVPTLQ